MVICTPQFGWAMKNEPMGFKDLYMHKDFRQVLIGDRKIEYSESSSELLHDKDFVAFNVFLDVKEDSTYLGIPMIEGFPLMAGFRQEKLRVLVLSFLGESMIETLHDAMVKEYGQPDYHKDGTWRWIGYHVVISLTGEKHTEKISFCTVMIMDKQFYGSFMN